jgi:hypothetical protein
MGFHVWVSRRGYRRPGDRDGGAGVDARPDLRARGIDAQAFPPVVMSMIVASLARILVLEQGLGITRGHSEALAFVQRYLDRFEMPSG